ncbi:protein transport protein HofC/type IV pilus assembly protein PilC [Paraperlucidibaca baekdonensis]|uniref:Protein transport protein HofC/type IV pilus assembly protein PilC n=1 Tax=Paraperlucidibaca baekdonensis TaxID=748120 RepID=A0A3E0H5G6_9GAMM|nr:type II secretion system F family protein [Paraperlucidibaca baekdonensis]REH38789.1 protein transport protein HofC/type IV pilus assembly protein PilC [Paraperlucidibaca baekdonensis]
MLGLRACWHWLAYQHRRAQAPSAVLRRQWLAQLAILLRSGIALHPALGLLQFQQPSAQQRWWQPVLDGIEHGQSLSHSLAQQQVFNASDTALLGMAEQTGRLNEQLSRLVTAQARRQQLYQQVQRAIRYPLVVLSGALLVSAYLLTQVVPSFAELYASFDAQLPWLTQRVMALSDWVGQYGLFLFAAIGIASVSVIWLWRHCAGVRTALASVLWHLPLAGPLARAQALGQWHRGLCETLAAGLSFVAALDCTASLIGQSPLARAQAPLRDAVCHGQRLSEALKQQPHYPALSWQMIAIGEESGMLATMLETLAEQFEAELARRCEQSVKLVEPLLMAFLGVIVGTLVLSLYLPLFQLGQVI